MLSRFKNNKKQFNTKALLAFMLAFLMLFSFFGSLPVVHAAPKYKLFPVSLYEDNGIVSRTAPANPSVRPVFGYSGSGIIFFSGLGGRVIEDTDELSDSEVLNIYNRVKTMKEHMDKIAKNEGTAEDLRKSKDEVKKTISRGIKAALDPNIDSSMTDVHVTLTLLGTPGLMTNEMINEYLYAPEIKKYMNERDEDIWRDAKYAALSTDQRLGPLMGPLIKDADSVEEADDQTLKPQVPAGSKLTLSPSYTFPGSDSDGNLIYSTADINKIFPSLYASIILSHGTGNDSISSVDLTLDKIKAYPKKPDENAEAFDYGQLEHPGFRDWISGTQNEPGRILSAYLKTLYDYGYLSPVAEDSNTSAGQLSFWKILTTYGPAGIFHKIVSAITSVVAEIAAAAYDFGNNILKMLYTFASKLNIVEALGLVKEKDKTLVQEYYPTMDIETTPTEGLTGFMYKTFKVLGVDAKFFKTIQLISVFIILATLILTLMTFALRFKGNIGKIFTRLRSVALRLFTIILIVPMTLMTTGIVESIGDSLFDNSTLSEVTNNYILDVRKWAAVENLSLAQLDDGDLSAENIDGQGRFVNFKPETAKLTKFNDYIHKNARNFIAAEESDTNTDNSAIRLLQAYNKHETFGIDEYLSDISSPRNENAKKSAIDEWRKKEGKITMEVPYKYRVEDKNKPFFLTNTSEGETAYTGPMPKDIFFHTPNMAKDKDENPDDIAESKSKTRKLKYGSSNDKENYTPYEVDWHSAGEYMVTDVNSANPSSYLYGAMPADSSADSNISIANYVGRLVNKNLQVRPPTDAKELSPSFLGRIFGDDTLEPKQAALNRNALAIALYNQHNGTLANYGTGMPRLSNQSVLFLLQTLPKADGSLIYRGTNIPPSKAGETKNIGSDVVRVQRYVIPHTNLTDFTSKLAELSLAWILHAMVTLLAVFYLLNAPIFGSIGKMFTNFLSAFFTGNLIALGRYLVYYLSLVGSFMTAKLGVQMMGNIMKNLIDLTRSWGIGINLITMGLFTALIFVLVTYKGLTFNVGRGRSAPMRVSAYQAFIYMPFILAEAADEWLRKFYLPLYGTPETQSFSRRFSNQITTDRQQGDHRGVAGMAGTLAASAAGLAYKAAGTASTTAQGVAGYFRNNNGILSDDEASAQIENGEYDPTAAMDNVENEMQNLNIDDLEGDTLGVDTDGDGMVDYMYRESYADGEYIGDIDDEIGPDGELIKKADGENVEGTIDGAPKSRAQLAALKNQLNASSGGKDYRLTEYGNAGAKQIEYTDKDGVLRSIPVDGDITAVQDEDGTLKFKTDEGQELEMSKDGVLMLHGKDVTDVKPDDGASTEMENDTNINDRGYMEIEDDKPIDKDELFEKNKSLSNIEKQLAEIADDKGIKTAIVETNPDTEEQTLVVEDANGELHDIKIEGIDELQNAELLINEDGEPEIFTDDNQKFVLDKESGKFIAANIDTDKINADNIDKDEADGSAYADIDKANIDEASISKDTLLENNKPLQDIEKQLSEIADYKGIKTAVMETDAETGEQSLIVEDINGDLRDIKIDGVDELKDAEIVMNEEGEPEILTSNNQKFALDKETGQFKAIDKETGSQANVTPPQAGKDLTVGVLRAERLESKEATGEVGKSMRSGKTEKDSEDTAKEKAGQRQKEEIDARKKLIQTNLKKRIDTQAESYYAENRNTSPAKIGKDIADDYNTIDNISKINNKLKLPDDKLDIAQLINEQRKNPDKTEGDKIIKVLEAAQRGNITKESAVLNLSKLKAEKQVQAKIKEGAVDKMIAESQNLGAAAITEQLTNIKKGAQFKQLATQNRDWLNKNQGAIDTKIANIQKERSILQQKINNPETSDMDRAFMKRKADAMTKQIKDINNLTETVKLRASKAERNATGSFGKIGKLTEAQQIISEKTYGTRQSAQTVVDTAKRVAPTAGRVIDKAVTGLTGAEIGKTIAEAQQERAAKLEKSQREKDQRERDIKSSEAKARKSQVSKGNKESSESEIGVLIDELRRQNEERQVFEQERMRRESEMQKQQKEMEYRRSRDIQDMRDAMEDARRDDIY